MKTRTLREVRRDARTSGAGWRRRVFGVLLTATATGLAAGCELHPDPPPQFESTNYGGEGDRMAQCMQFASESYCEQKIWGGP